MLIISDLHLKENAPHIQASYQFFQWLDEKFPDEIIVLLGDCFTNSAPRWSTYAMFKTFLTTRKNKVYIIQGNHSLSYQKGSALDGLHLTPNVKVFFDMEECMIENHKCLFMPYVHGNLKEKYENVTGNFSYVFTHLTPNFVSFMQDIGIKFNENLKCKNFIHGHIHLQENKFNHIIVGTPYSTRMGEHLQEHRILEIKEDDTLVYHKVPQYFTYEDIEYGILPENKNNIYSIKNCPSIANVREMYSKDYYIREDGCTIKYVNENGIDDTLTFDNNFNLAEKFLEFCN